MAENGAEREESREPEESGVPFDEEAAWAAIVAGYGEEPEDPPGARPFKSVEDLARTEAASRGDTRAGDKDTGDKDAGDKDAGDKDAGDRDEAKNEEGGEPGEGTVSGVRPLGGSVAFAPGLAGGPRDHSLARPGEDDLGPQDEGHFVQPDPPLPTADVTSKFAWIAVIGGPVLTLLIVLLGWTMTWWLATLCIGGFVGGFATLVMRMGDGEDDEDDPGRGAVV
ncbi:hypothetical protein AB0J21_13530 [Streptomyces sp. NPDC049954]|uniref:hypothetical protein n=1 Tax=Streptomyces sp. NPDC049954 TaxID=3155779 RepID=UPI00342A865B